MAFTSSSSMRKSFKYDVFLSFRGEDTRKNFVDHLYFALHQKSIHTYKDDENIKKGKTIGDELIKSIEDSRFYIIVFSKNYASSSWCLDELVKIMECQKITGQTAYPVFYDVEPTEVRKQSGSVGHAFANYKNHEVAGKWREALKEAADLAGWELKNTVDGHEAKFIQKIVEEISLELRSINLGVDEKLVGMNTRMKEIISSLETGIQDVRMIGIKGIGGGGKTTLARAVFDHIGIQFEGKSFVENVREVSTTSSSGLKSLQKQVLSDVLNDPLITVSSVYDGKNMMKRMMHGKKVLVVLDDVDHIDQLEALFADPNWFKPGSRIIITTRDEQVLVAHRINFIHDVNLLSSEEAICLFSRYAFGKEIPVQGYKELSKEVVRYAAGLPLTIRVLGSFLCGKDELEWIDALERLKTIPLKETLKKLELSYVGLEEDYKEIFLDVACLLKSWKKDEAVRMLESCGFHARNGLRVLEQKSLITITAYGHLDMHDHIEEMGRNIVRRMHPDEPNKHSRLWIGEEIEDILRNDLGTEATRCIKLNTPACLLRNDLGTEATRCIKLNTPAPILESVLRGIGNMKKLRFLCMYHCAYGGEVSQHFPNALRYLKWEGYPFLSLPETFQANNLVGLVLSSSDIKQFWKGGKRKVLNKLRFLDLSDSHLTIFDLGMTPNLERLKLKECYELEELHMPDGCPKLKFLSVSDSKLKIIDLRMTPNLERLNLKTCDELEELHMPDGCPKLKKLSVSYSKLRNLDLGMASVLETLILERCICLEELHMPFGCRKLKYISVVTSKLRNINLGMSSDLETLNLVGCFDLVELQMPIGCPKLKFVSLDNSKLGKLNLGLSSDLKTLSLEGCCDLLELHMPYAGCLNLKSINLSQSMVRTLTLGPSPNLERLVLKDCYNLVEMHASVGCLKKLAYLDLSGCWRFKSFLFNRFHSLEVYSLAELHLIGESLDICPLHIDSNMPKFRFECFYRKNHQPLDENLEKLISLGLPKFRFECFYRKNHQPLDENLEKLISLGLPKFQFKCFYRTNHQPLDENLEKLISLGRCVCTNLENFSDSICSLQNLRKLALEVSIPEVPKDLDRLECLQELILSSTKIKCLPDSILMLKHLKLLELKSCWLIERLPEDIGQLKCLEDLYLRECILLQDIPNSICEIKRLKCFHLPYCFLVEKLPEDLGLLVSLEELNVEGTGISHLPRSIFRLKGLRILGSRWRLESYGFTTMYNVSSTYMVYCNI